MLNDVEGQAVSAVAPVALQRWIRPVWPINCLELPILLSRKRVDHDISVTEGSDKLELWDRSFMAAKVYHLPIIKQYNLSGPMVCKLRFVEFRKQ